MTRTFEGLLLGLAALGLSDLGAASQGLRLPGEYEPVGAVLISEDTVMHGPAGVDLVRAVLAAGAEAWIVLDQQAPPKGIETRYTIQGIAGPDASKVRAIHQPHGSFWVRDHGPVPALQAWKAEDPALVFLDFRFESPFENVDDFPSALGARLGIPVHAYPLDLDGGNILVAGGTCLIGATVSLERFAKTSELGRLLTQSESQRRPILDSIGCRDVLIVPDAPHEHIDMFVKAVGPDVLLVNQLDRDALARRLAQEDGYLPEFIKNLDRSLESTAARLSQKFRVIRLPMPVPEQEVFRTYANGILVNGQAILPSYRAKNPDDKELARIEEEAARIYRDQGFTVTFVNAEPFITNGGALHCVTVQIPKIP